MVADGYKDTEVGIIPIEWDVVKLDSLGKIITGSTPKTSNQDFYLNGTRLWASPSDLGKSKEVKTTNTKLSDLGFEQIRVLDKRSILITCIGSTIGKMGIAYEEMSSNQQINAITCNEDNNPDFYYYVLFKIKDKIQKLAGTQAVPLLNKTDFSQIKVIQPPLKEQEKIADILSTADDKIDIIATQIKKSEILKKGLLQKLLNEGIGHSEFKDSELGKIAESWEVVELGNVSDILDPHPSHRAPKEEANGYPFVGIGDISENGIINLSSARKVSLDDVVKQNKSIQINENDIGFGRVASVGKIIKFNRYDFPFALSPTMAVVKAKQINNSFLYQFLSSDLTKKQFKSLTSGSTRIALGIQNLRKLLISIPPLKEQKQIADILSTADEKLEVLRAKKEKYETLKKGLLQKLLSGEVRV